MKSQSCTLILLFAFAALSPAAHAQVFKCTIDGKSAYQQKPCGSGNGSKMDLRPSVPSAPLHAQAQPVAAPAAPAPAPAPAPVAFVPSAPVKSEIEQQSDMCLSWYRPGLRDPQSAYYRDPSIENGVLTFTLHATNGYGGFVPKTARCEFKNGALDNDWTKIHAKRLGWSV